MTPEEARLLRDKIPRPLKWPKIRKGWVDQNAVAAAEMDPETDRDLRMFRRALAVRVFGVDLKGAKSGKAKS